MSFMDDVKIGFGFARKNVLSFLLAIFGMLILVERWAEICPPNDVRKRDEVESWIRDRVEDWLDKKEWVDW